MINAQRLAFPICILLAAALLNPLPVMSQQPPMTTEDLQNQAAEDWFKLADEGQYEASYTAASSEAKNRMTSSQWQSAVSAERESLGERVTRGLDARNNVTTLEGWPSGEYVVLTFSSSFANDPGAVETLTLKKDTDGVWRAAVYSVQ